MKIEVGDLLFCHTIGNKFGWHLNQVGLVTEGNQRKTRFKIFLGSGKFSEVTQNDLVKGNVQIISKASGEEVSGNVNIVPKLPNIKE
jgi:hypothetical protein|tara:strand:+ start:369 stop:629 length:261 start_codon:yes stop_codon:yes gene_type:complete